MASRLLFFVATFGLFATAACFSDKALDLNLDDGYNIAMQAIVKMLWKSFQTDIQSKSNVLFFTTPSARDISFIREVLDKEMKKRIMKSLPLYDNFDKDLEKAEERLTGNEMQFKTIFYGELEEMTNRMLIGHASSKLSKPNKRFELITNNKEDAVKKLNELRSAVMKSGLGATCEVRLCAFPIIQKSNNKEPFAILTLASWKITAIHGFTFTTHNEFALSETSSTSVSTVQGSGNFDYAEFKYSASNDCAGEVIRLPYKSDHYLTFVIPSAEKMCSSIENLWKNVQNVNLNDVQYKNQAMFVSIPLFNVSANIDLKMKLKGTILSDAFYKVSSRLYNTGAFQAAEVIFNPQVPKIMMQPAIPVGAATSIFKVNRPFFFALLHKKSPTPIFAGLVHNPGCIRNC